jgi:hypothetical protein
MKRGITLITVLFLAVMEVSSWSSKRIRVYNDFTFKSQIRHVYLDYFKNGEEIYDNFPSEGWIEINFWKQGNGNLLKIKYQLEKFGDHVFIKYVHNVVVYKWLDNGYVNYSIKDTDDNSIIDVSPWGDPENRYDIWMWNEWLITDK